MSNKFNCFLKRDSNICYLFAMIIVVFPLKLDHRLRSEVGDVGASVTISGVTSGVMNGVTMVECTRTGFQWGRLSLILKRVCTL